MQWLLSLLGGPVVGLLLDGYKAKLASTNTQDRLAVDLALEQIRAETAASAEATKVLTLENGHWWMWLPRWTVQVAAATFFCKCVIWDTILGWGTTPALHGSVEGTYTAVMLMWFGGRTVEKTASIVASVFRR